MRASVLHASVIALSSFVASASFANEAVPYGAQPNDEPMVGYDASGSGYSYGEPTSAPSYGHGGQASAQQPPPPPPPSKRKGPEWNIRFNPFELLQGRASFAGEYAIGGPVTVALAPTYVYGTPVTVSGDGYDVGGWALALQPGFWLEGTPFHRLALKLHLEHESVTFRIKASDGSEEKTSLGLNKVGAMIVSQSVYGGWFSLSYGLGLKKDLSYDEGEHTVTCPGADPGTKGCIVASGLGRGFDMIGEFGIGVVF